MKPLYLKKNTQSQVSSFLTLKTNVPHLYDKWHYHRELELLYVINGRGTRFVGDCVQDFDDGDMVLVGSNLPHVWKNDRIYYTDQSLQASVILVQFVHEILSDHFLSLPEMIQTKKLIDDSSRGLKVDKGTAQLIAPVLESLIDAQGANRLILLLSVLDKIANSDYQLLSSNWFSTSYTESKNERINQVYDHIMKHFREQITLDELASVAHMNSSALCRYFKSSTHKTISEFINEVRIGYAFNLLRTKDYNVTRACFESGFNNLSYFNRQFKKLLGYPPSTLRRNLKIGVSEN